MKFVKVIFNQILLWKFIHFFKLTFLLKGLTWNRILVRGELHRGQVGVVGTQGRPDGRIYGRGQGRPELNDGYDVKTTLTDASFLTSDSMGRRCCCCCCCCRCVSSIYCCRRSCSCCWCISGCRCCRISGCRCCRDGRCGRWSRRIVEVDDGDPFEFDQVH